VTISPLAPEPDTKDWTWVIRQPCPECGFEPDAVERSEIPGRARRYAAVLTAALERDDATVRSDPAVWSAAEYACHVRDVCELFAHRLHRMLAEDDPLFDNWNQDVTALEKRYWEQAPSGVAGQLTAGADGIADAFAGVEADQWKRPGRRSDGSVFTVDTFARYFLHDLAHHAWDVTGRQVR
jgi:hypothetical protein